jgi:hypothetical protein
MKVAPNLSPAEIREQAQRWFDRQREVLAQSLGDAWPRHQAWIEEYLKGELRTRLIALGWRAKR